MRVVYILLFFITLSVSAQIELKIDTITSVDFSPKKRIFKIKYHVKNLTNNKLSFFLTPNSAVPFSLSSLTLYPLYKIYQKGIFENVDDPFYEKIFKEHDEFEYLNDSVQKNNHVNELIEKYILEYKNFVKKYKENGGTSTDDVWIYANQKLLKSIITLNSNETKEFIIEFNWNKKRYYKIEDNEFYIDKKDKFEIELSLFLDKSNRKNALSEDEFSKFNTDVNFIQGIFISNKKEIDLKE